MVKLHIQKPIVLKKMHIVLKPKSCITLSQKKSQPRKSDLAVSKLLFTPQIIFCQHQSKKMSQASISLKQLKYHYMEDMSQ